ncbi:MAG TPA: histidine kinase [Polyangiaceae bacterium]|nr:histidine kinase [Polyangiaceae bacterium]
MHPLFAPRRPLLAYLLFWAGLSVVPWVLLDSAAPFGAFTLTLLSTVAFAFFTLPTWYLCRALPLRPGRTLRVLSIHGAAAAVWSLLFVATTRLLGEAFGLFPEWHRLPLDVSRAESALFGVGALFYLLVATFHYVLAELQLRHEAHEREAALAVNAQRAELQALRAQVHPHFLFNSLNTVNALIGYDPNKAREACVLLAEYLRGTLRAQDQALVSLRVEWALCERYLKVEALRLGERLRIDIEIDENAAQCLVPSLLLQPLVENAMTHAITPVEDPLPFRIRAERRGERLAIRLENGVDPAPRARDGGVGLTNVRARLFAQYGEDASLRIEKDSEHFVVLLDLPARPPNAEAKR